tara:strand:+ start:44 stop:832 length:789 start_codon:yes stop_codon:yes gene_type:complete
MGLTGKHFTVEVKPTIAGNRQSAGSASYSDNDVLFDWTSFQIPKGGAKLVSIAVIMRGKDGGPQESKDIDFFFAKEISGVAPTTIGNSNATALAAPAVANHIIGWTHIDGGGDFGGKTLDHFSVGASGSGAVGSNIPALVLQGENTGVNVGFDTLYLAATCAEANISFGTTVLVRGAIEANSTRTIPTDAGSDDDPNAENIFAVGDVIETGTGDTVGTVASISAFDTDHQDIILEANNVEAIANNEELFNVNPIRVILSFER